MQEDAGLRAAKAEAELRSLQERLREEQAACDALKKQMGEAWEGQVAGRVMWAPLRHSLGCLPE